MSKTKKIQTAAVRLAGPALVILAMTILISCDFLFDVGTAIIVNLLDSPIKSDQFYAQDMNTGKYYVLNASKMNINSDYCVVYAEKGCGITTEQAQAVADEYDVNVHQKIISAFSKENFYDNDTQTTYSNILEYANKALAGGQEDGKLTILLLDIKDSYVAKKNLSYVAGYFFGGDLYTKGPIGGGHYSNGRDMIYIDTYPGMQVEQRKTAYTTLAHELQHLINNVTSRQMKRRVGSTQTYMDTWIDEGLSSQAEHIYLGDYVLPKCERFRDDTNGTIRKGNNFFSWGNKEDDILDDYATVYMFFRWLDFQAGSPTNYFKKVEESPYYDYRIITDLTKQNGWDTWEKVLVTWLAANYYPGSSYGYKKDAIQNYVKGKTINLTSITLDPGEGVYSVIKAGTPFTPDVSGPNIRYAGITATAINTGTSSITGDILITFNGSAVCYNNGVTEPKPISETGYLTGSGLAVPSPAAARFITGEQAGGPWVIDARDLMARNRGR